MPETKMKSKLLLWALLAALGAALAPSMAFAGASYVNPDGSYPSYDAFIRNLDGTPCGITCSARLAQERQQAATAQSRSGYYAIAPEHYRGE
jgi:uncharacterized membrane protein